MTGALADSHRKGHPVAFVPTMGYLHAGHEALIRRARELADRVVVSIFVNPLQFGPKEDFERYPRDLKRDERIATAAGATDIFAPQAAELTPGPLTVRVDPGPLGRTLCGKSRPGHFAGVCTIVAKLFHIVQPTHAVFGWKDAQQFLILRRMVEDLNLTVQMEGVETLREPNGLAMSSRNVYLSETERSEAPWLYRALQRAHEKVLSGQEFRGPKLAAHVTDLLKANTQARIDYVRAVSTSDLESLPVVQEGHTMIAAAAWFGTTRLIDNIRF